LHSSWLLVEAFCPLRATNSYARRRSARAAAGGSGDAAGRRGRGRAGTGAGRGAWAGRESGVPGGGEFGVGSVGGGLGGWAYYPARCFGGE
jgi:hypothetical protein